MCGGLQLSRVARKDCRRVGWQQALAECSADTRRSALSARGPPDMPLSGRYCPCACMQVFKAYCDKKSIEQSAVRFVFDGQRVNGTATPESVSGGSGTLASACVKKQSGLGVQLSLSYFLPRCCRQCAGSMWEETN